MQESTPLDVPERELEQALRALKPTPTLEQEIWYRAGLKAGARRLNFWRTGAAAVVFLAVGALVGRPKPATVTVDRLVYVAQPAGPIHVPSSDDSSRAQLLASFIQLRDTVQQQGLDALPPAGGAGVLDQPALRAWSPTVVNEMTSIRG